MAGAELDPKAVGCFALGGVFVSLGCALIFVLFGEDSAVRGNAGSCGVLTGALGGGVAMWCSFELRNRNATLQGYWGLWL